MEITEFLRRPNGIRQPIPFLPERNFEHNHLLTLCDGLCVKTYKQCYAENKATYQNLYIELVPTVIFLIFVYKVYPFLRSPF